MKRWTYVVVLGSVLQEVSFHAHVDDISTVSKHDTIAWDSVLWQFTEFDLGGLRVVFGISGRDDGFLASQDVWLGDIEFHVVFHVDLDVSWRPVRAIRNDIQERRRRIERERLGDQRKRVAGMEDKIGSG